MGLSRFASVLGAACVAAAVPAHAQATDDQTTGSAQPSGSGTEPIVATDDGNEIVVTARRTSELLQDIPIAVTALSGDGLTERNIKSLDKLAGFVPNFQFDTGAAISASTFATTAFIRGVGQNDYAVFTDPGVGLYVDGVYFARSLGAGLDNFEIERVEVLRGPQGTLFGKNTIGGAINVIMRKPGETFGGYAEAATGRYDKIYLQGAVDLPVSPTLTTRFAAGYFKKNGYTQRILDGVRQGDKDNTLLRGTAVFEPASNLTFTLATDYTDGKSNGAPLTLGGVQPSGLFLVLFNQLVAPRQGIVAPNGQPTYNASFVTGDPYTTFGTADVRNSLLTYGVSLTGNWDVGPATLRSITAYRYLKARFGRDGDSSPFAFRETLQLETSKQFSQEFQIIGSSFDDRLGWLLGAYYFDEIGYDQVDLVLARGLFEALEALPGPLPNGFGGRGNPRNVGLDNSLFDVNDVRNTTYALFANVTFKLTDWLTLEGGVRQNWDEKSFDPVHLRVASNVFIAPPGSHFEASFKSFTPRVALMVEASEDINLYASYSRGFKSGGFNARPLGSIAEINKYEPETVSSYEIGVKSRFFNRRLVVNAAVFTSDYVNIQLPVNQPPQNFVFNAGAGRIRGVEIESTARLGESFVLNGSFGYLDAKYTKIGQNTAPGQFVPITLASKFIKTPEVTWSAGAQYTYTLASDGKVSLRGDYTRKSSYFNDVANSPQIFQPGFGLLSARLSFAAPSNRFVVAVSATNLTNEKYLTAGNVAGAALGRLVEQTFSAPSEWELSARFNF